MNEFSPQTGQNMLQAAASQCRITKQTRPDLLKQYHISCTFSQPFLYGYLLCLIDSSKALRTYSPERGLDRFLFVSHKDRVALRLMRPDNFPPRLGLNLCCQINLNLRNFQARQQLALALTDIWTNIYFTIILIMSLHTKQHLLTLYSDNGSHHYQAFANSGEKASLRNIVGSNRALKWPFCVHYWCLWHIFTGYNWLLKASATKRKTVPRIICWNVPAITYYNNKTNA